MSYQDYIKTYGSSEEEKIIMKKKIATILTAAVIGATAVTTIVSAWFRYTWSIRRTVWN